MSTKSRYADTEVLDGNHYATYSLPITAKGYRTLNLLDGVRYDTYFWSRGDRFDKLAGRWWNKEADWWVITLCNDISYPLLVEPGTEIKIPLDPQDIKRKILK